MVAILMEAAVMFFGSLVVGYLPLLLTSSQHSMRLLSTLGTGMLIGTAFSIIIPEGVHLTYLPVGGHGHGHGHSHVPHVALDMEPVQTVVETTIFKDFRGGRRTLDLAMHADIHMPDAQFTKIADSTVYIHTRSILSSEPIGASQQNRYSVTPLDP